MWNKTRIYLFRSVDPPAGGAYRRPSMQFPPLISTAVVALLASMSSPAFAAQSRIPAHPNLTAKTRLTGHLVPWATSVADTGTAPDVTPIHLTLLLARTSALQSAFDQLLVDQQNPASSSFHQWLTPAEIGDQYGPTLDEIATVTQWLSSQGLQVTAVSASRTFLDVTGTTGTASAAFATSFHQYAVTGDTQPTRLAATSEPAVPTALAPVVQSIEGLAEIPFRSFHTVHAADTLTPFATSSGGAHYLFPGDFARIYDIAATTSAGYDGTGIKIAIAGQSRITASDVTELQVMAGLPAKAPNTILLPASADPGLVKGDEDESTLDVTRAATVAPGTQVDLVIAANASGGVSAAIQYAVNTVNDPILSVSYGACESATNASSVQFYNTLFGQAAAQGITILVSSGDSAAAGCASSFSVPTGKEVLAMGNYLCSSSYVTCVGGTEFADAGLDSTYWSSNNSANYTSALGYIPEGAWNEPTVTSSTGVVTYQIAGSGGGPSAYIAKPTWQTGTGVPADGFRDIPDVAFTTANHDGYFACLAYVGSAGDCSKGGGVIFSGTSASAPDMAGIAALLNQRLGTSQGNLNPLLYRLAAASSNAFHDATPASSGVSTCSIATPSPCNNSVAGKASLTGGLAGYPLQPGYDLVTGLGSLDVTNFLTAAIVPIAASTVTLTVPTTTLPAGQSLAITATVATGTSTSTPTGTIQFASAAFTTATTALTGGKASDTAVFTTPGTYAVTAAYSGDTNFQAATATPISIRVTAAATTTALTLSSNLLTIGSSVTFTASIAPVGTTTLNPTGTVQFYSNGSPIGSPATLSSATAVSAALPFTTNGAYTITAIYSGDSNNLTSTSAPATLTVAAAGATVTTLTTQTNTLTPATATILTARITGNGTQTPTGTVQFMANSTALAPAVTLAGGAATLSYPGFIVPGTYILTAVYAGDTNNLASTSAPAPVVVSKYTTVASTFTASATTFSSAQSTILRIALSAPSTSAPAPTGTIQISVNNTAMGAPIAISSQIATSPALTFSSPGTYVITAAYTGDANYSSASLTGPTLSVTQPTITLTPSPATLTLTSGATTGNTSILTVSTPNGFTGTVSLACALTSTPSAAVNAPTCSLTSSTLTVAAAAATTTLTIATTVPHTTPSTTSARSTAILPVTFTTLALVLLPFRRRTLRVRAPLLLLALALSLSGCSASVSSSATTSTPTPTPVLVGTTTGAYTITVTATGASPTTTTLSLNVQ